MLLAFGLFSALLTLHAQFPLRGRFAITGVMLSWLVRELALHHVAWQVLAAAAITEIYGFDPYGASLLAVSWLWLLALRNEARRATTIVSAALDVSGAPPYQSRMAIERRRSLPFASVGETILFADMLRPRREGRFPAVIHLHGGSWVMGYKEYQGVPLLTHLASNGFVTFNVDYRLSPKVAFPEHLHDVKRAIVWVRKNADVLGVDPSFVAVSGGSAGAHLAAMAALTQNDPVYQPGFEDEDTSVQAALCFYGTYDFLARKDRHWITRMEQRVMQTTRGDGWKHASPIERVHADAPPFFIVHGDKDSLAPVTEARAFVERLRACSQQPAVYVEVRGAGHNFDLLPSARTIPIIEGAERFLVAMRARS